MRYLIPAGLDDQGQWAYESDEWVYTAKVLPGGDHDRAVATAVRRSRVQNASS